MVGITGFALYEVYPRYIQKQIFHSIHSLYGVDAIF